MKPSANHSFAVLFLSITAIACSEPAGSHAIICASEADTIRSEYRPIEPSSLPAAEVTWAGRPWRVNSGAVKDPPLTYAIQTSHHGNKLRIELRDGARDNSPNDSPGVRRAELSGSLYGDTTRLPNGQALWGAYTFRHHSWADPERMRALTGGVYGQIHMGSAFGGSPALAFRRTRSGAFQITTRGELDPEGSVRYEAPLSFDEVHDLVYRVILHPTDGSLTVWLDGEPIVQVTEASIGHSNGESYWNFGLYFSGGIADSVVAEFANHVYPAPESLENRVSAPPCWPRH